MERVWNYVHYTIFNFYKKMHKLLTYIDPFRLIYKIPAIKKFYAKGGIKDMNQFTDDIIFNNEKSGLFSIWAGIQMGGLLVFFGYSLFNIFQALIGKSLIQFIWENNVYKILFIVILLLLPWIINEQFLFKKDKYLKYFEEFDNQPKSMRKKWSWISLGIILFIILFFIASFFIYSAAVF